MLASYNFSRCSGTLSISMSPPDVVGMLAKALIFGYLSCVSSSSSVTVSCLS